MSKKDLKDFINRCNTELEYQLTCEYERLRKRKLYINSGWIKNNREAHRKMTLRYSKTLLGRYACSLRNAKTRQKQNNCEFEISTKEKKDIGRFYKNCPVGKEVDHIIPLSKGGKHIFKNLQYLTHLENIRKREF